MFLDNNYYIIYLCITKYENAETILCRLQVARGRLIKAIRTHIQHDQAGYVNDWIPLLRYF